MAICIRSVLSLVIRIILKISIKTDLERRAGIEPANTGFADLRVRRFATGAYATIAEIRPK
jgi:hypothetical protein